MEALQHHHVLDLAYRIGRIDEQQFLLPVAQSAREGHQLFPTPTNPRDGLFAQWGEVLRATEFAKRRLTEDSRRRLIQFRQGADRVADRIGGLPCRVRGGVVAKSSVARTDCL